ncbi:MAG: hypothetical protein KKA79_07030 [Nanoarchaeota archaeon]|nr:hypothetical protein [Nanoarchaeota archaeon]
MVIGAFLYWQFFIYDSSFKLSDDPSPPPEDIENLDQLQTYTNREFGFEFQYPADWETKESPYGSPSGKFLLTINPPKIEYSSALSIYMVTPEWLSLVSNRDTSDITIDGIKGIKYGVDTKADIRSIYIALPLRGYSLILKSGEQYEYVFSKVVSTFKFFSASGIPQRIVESKTYRNEKWDFEFQYPSDWIIKENYFGSLVSKFNLEVVPVIGGTSFPDPVFINIVTADFGDHAFQYLNNTALEVRVGDVLGKRYDYEFEGMQRVSILLPFGKYQMILGAEKRYEDVFNQVIDTFKFLDIS